MSLLIFLLIVSVSHGTGELIVIIGYFFGLVFAKKILIIEVESETQLNRRVEQKANRFFDRRILLPRYRDLDIWVAPRPNTVCHSSCSLAVPALIDNTQIFECTVNLTDVSYGSIDFTVLIL